MQHQTFLKLILYHIPTQKHGECHSVTSKEKGV